MMRRGSTVFGAEPFFSCSARAAHHESRILIREEHKGQSSGREGRCTSKVRSRMRLSLRPKRRCQEFDARGRAPPRGSRRGTRGCAEQSGRDVRKRHWRRSERPASCCTVKRMHNSTWVRHSKTVEACRKIISAPSSCLSKQPSKDSLRLNMVLATCIVWVKGCLRMSSAPRDCSSRRLHRATCVLNTTWPSCLNVAMVFPRMRCALFSSSSRRPCKDSIMLRSTWRICF